MTNKTMWMKVSAMLLAFLLVLPAGVLAVPEVVVPENVITNGTFADVNEDGKADDWVHYDEQGFIKLVTSETEKDDMLIPSHLETPLTGYEGNYLQIDARSSANTLYFWKREVKADTIYRGTVYYKGGNYGTNCKVSIQPHFWTSADDKNGTAVRAFISDYNEKNPSKQLPEYDCAPFAYESDSSNAFVVTGMDSFTHSTTVVGGRADGWARAEFVFRFSDFRNGNADLANGSLGICLTFAIPKYQDTSNPSEGSMITLADFSLVESDEFMLNGDFKDGSHFWTLSTNCNKDEQGVTSETPCHTFEDGVMTMEYTYAQNPKHTISLAVLPSTIYRLTYEATTSETEEATWPWVSISGSATLWANSGSTERTNHSRPKSALTAYQNATPVAGAYDTYEFYFQTLPAEKTIVLNFYPNCVLPDHSNTRPYGIGDTLSIKNISLRMVTESELSLVDGTTRTELTSFSPENPVRVRGAYLTAADDANVQPMAAVYKETEDGTMQLISLQLGKTYAPATRSYDWQGASWQPMNMIRFDEVFDFSGADLPALGEGEDYTIQAFVFDSMTGIKPLAKSAYVK